MTCSAFQMRRALENNSTATAFTAKIPTATEPSGVGVIDVFSAAYGFGGDTYSPDYIQVIPFGTNGADDTFDMRIWGWSKVVGADLWIPQLIADLSVTLGSISGSAIAANTFLADTIVVNAGTSSGVISTADDTSASGMFHLRGCSLLEFDFDLAGAQEAVSMNAYWRLMHSIR